MDEPSLWQLWKRGILPVVLIFGGAFAFAGMALVWPWVAIIIVGVFLAVAILVIAPIEFGYGRRKK